MAAPSFAVISRPRGDTNAFTVNITDGTSPINISGYSFKFTVDPSPSPANADNNLFQLTSPASGITITDAANGEISIALNATQADQSPGTYYFDLEMTDAGSLITTILKGDWEVTQDITK